MSMNPIFKTQPIKVHLRPKTIVHEEERDKTRKTRSDKLQDIKIAVSDEEKKWLRVLASKANHKSITRIATQLLREGIDRRWLIDHSTAYDPKGKLLVHVKPNQLYYADLERLAIEWNMSIRAAAHRIVISVLNYKVQEGELYR